MQGIVDVVGVGQCSLDCIVQVSAYPPPDTKCEFQEMSVQGGGPVATALVALSRWGVSCAFSGVIGDDDFGDRIRESLDGEGIDTAGLRVRPGSSSQLAFAVAEAGSGRRTIFWKRPSGPPLSPAEIDPARIRAAHVLHTDGLFVEAGLTACRAARKAGVPVVVDAGSLREGMLDIARESDYFIASENFAISLLGRSDPAEACRRIRELGPKLAGVTLGEKGYVALAEGRLIHRPAYPEKAIDTTGCGDVFHAAFIFGLLRGCDMERCLDLGAWAASRVSLKLGGRAGIPSMEEMVSHASAWAS